MQERKSETTAFEVTIGSSPVHVKTGIAGKPPTGTTRKITDQAMLQNSFRNSFLNMFYIIQSKNIVIEHFSGKPGKGRPGFGKPGKGNGKRPKGPCDGKQNIVNCSCEDGGFFINLSYKYYIDYFHKYYNMRLMTFFEKKNIFRILRNRRSP